MRNEIFTVIDDINITITSIDGKVIELSKLMLEVEIYENIFDMFLSGRIVIVDTLDLLKNLPIIGNEKLTFNIHTSDTTKSISLTFYVYKINKDAGNYKNDYRKRLLDIAFCSKELLQNNRIKISQKFNDYPHNIVSDIFTDYFESLKSMQLDISSEIVEVYSNNWIPTKLIDFLTKISKSSSYSDYIFFESLSGFHFKNLSSLLASNSIHDVTFDYTTDSFIGNTNTKLYKFDDYFDIIEGLKNGIFGHTFYKPHDTEYSFQKTEKNLTDNINKIMTNGSSIYFDTSLNEIENIIDVNYFDPEITSIRSTSLNLLRNYNLVIKLNGDFSREVGNILSLNFPKIDNNSTINESFDGNWFIAGIKHIIKQNNSYNQNLKLIKNAFFKNKKLETITSMKNL